MNLTPLERAILEQSSQKIDDKCFLEQVQSVQVESREHTGAGLFVYFYFPLLDEVPPILGASKSFPGPDFKSPVLELGAGSIIWCGPDGFLSCIEIFSFSDCYPTEEFEFEISKV